MSYWNSNYRNCDSVTVAMIRIRILFFELLCSAPSFRQIFLLLLDSFKRISGLGSCVNLNRYSVSRSGREFTVGSTFVSSVNKLSARVEFSSALVASTGSFRLVDGNGKLALIDTCEAQQKRRMWVVCLFSRIGELVSRWWNTRWCR